MKRSKDGFTMVELMIATAVFSVVLLLCATAAVQVGRMFYKGVLINRVQDTARKVVEDASQSVQFGVNTNAGFRRIGGVPGEIESRCIGEVRYSFHTKKSLGNGADQLKHVLWKDRIPSAGTCDPVLLTDDAAIEQSRVNNDGQELLGDNMRVPLFEISETPFGSVVSWAVDITVSYGNEDELFISGSNFSKCIAQHLGGQFCAVSSISTLVEKRL